MVLLYQQIFVFLGSFLTPKTCFLEVHRPKDCFLGKKVPKNDIKKHKNDKNGRKNYKNVIFVIFHHFDRFCDSIFVVLV